MLSLNSYAWIKGPGLWGLMAATAFAALFLSSCHDDDPDPMTGKRLKKVSSYGYDSDTSLLAVGTYEYESGRLTRITLDIDNVYGKYQDIATYEYSTGKVTMTQVNGGLGPFSDNIRHEYFLENDRPTEKYAYQRSDSGWVFFYRTVYTYVGDDLARAVQYRERDGEMVVYYDCTYNWSDGLLEEIVKMMPLQEPLSTSTKTCLVYDQGKLIETRDSVIVEGSWCFHTNSYYSYSGDLITGMGFYGYDYCPCGALSTRTFGISRFEYEYEDGEGNLGLILRWQNPDGYLLQDPTICRVP